MDNINLRVKMAELAEFELVHYKTGLDHDFNIMLDIQQPLGVYYWYIRECGTHMTPEHRVFVEGDWSNVEAFYWAGYNPKVYKITLKERKKKNFFGDIQEIKLKEFVNLVEANTRKATGADIKFLTKEGKAVYTSVNGTENIHHKALDNLKLTPEDIISTYVEKYLFS